MSSSTVARNLIYASHNLMPSSTSHSLNYNSQPTTDQDHQEQSDSATAGSGNSSHGRKRVRTGCLNCRRKHKKCDENKPVCHGCVSKNEACEWPAPKLKKASRRNSLHYTTTTLLQPATSISSTSMKPAQPVPFLPHPSFTTNVLPRTAQLGINYTPQHFPQEQGQVSNSFPPTSQITLANPHIRKPSTDLFSYSLSQQQPQHSNQLLSDSHSVYSSSNGKDDSTRHSPGEFPLVTSLPVMRSESIERMPTSGLTADELLKLGELAKLLETFLMTGLPTPSSSTTTSPLLMREDDQIRLMSIYLTDIAPTLEVGDELFFTEELPPVMKHEPALFYSVLALSALKPGSAPTVSPLFLFKHALTNLIAARRPSQQSLEEQTVVKESTLLFLTLFLYYHSQHGLIVHHLRPTIPQIAFHTTLFRLTLSQIVIPADLPANSLPYSLLPLLSIHQHDFLTAFNRAISLLPTLPIVLEEDCSPFPQILISSQRNISIHILLNTALVILLTHKPLDVKVRSHPVSQFAKRLCGMIVTNTGRVPWYAQWCLFTVGKVFTHESEHAKIIELLKELGGEAGWDKKIKDYWEGRGDV